MPGELDQSPSLKMLNLDPVIQRAHAVRQRASELVERSRAARAGTRKIWEPNRDRPDSEPPPAEWT